MCTRPESDDASCSPSSSVLGVGRIPPPNSVDEHSYAADYRERKRLVVETTREAREESAGGGAWAQPGGRCPRLGLRHGDLRSGVGVLRVRRILEPLEEVRLFVLGAHAGEVR